MNRRSSLSAALLLAALIAVACIWADRCRAGDFIFSALLTNRTPLQVSFQGVHIKDLSSLSFDSMSAASLSGKGWFRSGTGLLKADPSLPGMKGANLAMKDVIFEQEPARLVLGFLDASSKTLPISLKIPQARIRFRQNGQIFSLRFLDMREGDFSIVGGLDFNGKHLQKADLLIGLAEKVWRRFPSGVYSRLKTAKNGQRSFQLLFCRNTLTLRGSTGPFIRAHWQSGP